MLEYPDKRLFYGPDDQPDFHPMADWIESSVMFVDERLSQPDIRDVILENELGMLQDAAQEAVEDAFSELRWRAGLMGAASPFRIEANAIERMTNWQACAGYAFCLFLSLAEVYTNWSSRVPHSYSTQGELFEELSAESLRSWGWEVLRAGWGPGHTGLIPDVAKDVHLAVREPLGNLERYTTRRAKDEGLDLVCWMPFSDTRSGKPLYLVQCASGKDWPNKLKHPDLDVWMKVIDFAQDVKRGFAMPFHLRDAAFIRTSNKARGLMLDRYRLAVPRLTGTMVANPGLTERIVGYLSPRISALPLV